MIRPNECGRSFTHHVGAVDAGVIGEWDGEGSESYPLAKITSRKFVIGEGNRYGVEFEDGDKAILYSQNIKVPNQVPTHSLRRDDDSTSDDESSDEDTPMPVINRKKRANDSDEYDEEDEDSEDEEESGRKAFSVPQSRAPVKPRAKKKAVITSAVSTTTVVTIGGKEFELNDPTFEIKSKGNNKSTERKESRARKWGGRIQNCVNIVNPALADDWGDLDWGKDADKKVLMDYVLMPLLAGHVPSNYSGEFIIKDKEGNVKPMEPGSIKNALDEIKYYLKNKTPPLTLFSWKDDIFQQHGSVITVVTENINKHRIEFAALGYGNLPFRSEAPEINVFWDILESLDFNVPLQLLHGAFLVNGVGFCFRGRTDHDVLEVKEIKSVVDENGRVSKMIGSHWFKNHGQSCLTMTSERLNPAHIYQHDPEDTRDPHNILDKFIRKCPKGYTGKFYLYPFTEAQKSRNPVEANDGSVAWFNPKRPFGKDQQSQIVKIECTRLGFPVPPLQLGKWGAHGLRRLALKNMDSAKAGETRSKQFGRHKSNGGLAAYQEGDGQTRKENSAMAFGLPVEPAVEPRLRLSKARQAEPSSSMDSSAHQLRTPLALLPSPSAQSAFVPGVPSSAIRTPFGHPSAISPPIFLFNTTPTGSPPPPAAPPLSSPPTPPPVLGLKEQLRVLKESFEEGYMTEDEYAKAKAKALGI
mmetsp:Transcript_51314/g.103094  ORF Transcript_51314/g.103094 Transcript_51314/m.103094 type:complete len:696 (+) Transcript_51314:655-2742(+)